MLFKKSTQITDCGIHFLYLSVVISLIFVVDFTFLEIALYFHPRGVSAACPASSRSRKPSMTSFSLWPGQHDVTARTVSGWVVESVERNMSCKLSALIR